MRGIDVSKWNGVIDWDKVKSQIDFAIIRVGYIGNNENVLDEQFERNYAECRRLGIPVGVYVYNYVKTEARIRDCAKWTIDKLQGKELQLPVYLDMEDESIKAIGKQGLTNLCVAFNTEIETTERWAGVYASLDWFKNYLDTEEIKRHYTTWIAHVDFTNNQDKYKGQYDMFQYSWEGKIDGINGNVDMNMMYRNLVEEINGNTPTPAPQKSIDEIAQEVINGEWGNGEDRKNRLTNAGYDYNAVQAVVNNKLGYKPKVLEVGAKVKVIANGNGASDGSGKQAIKDYTGTVARIVNGAKYPYLVSNGSPIGWYKAEALKVI